MSSSSFFSLPPLVRLAACLLRLLHFCFLTVFLPFLLRDWSCSHYLKLPRRLSLVPRLPLGIAAAGTYYCCACFLFFLVRCYSCSRPLLMLISTACEPLVTLTESSARELTAV
ncbi:uncharacterized protein J3R85_005898 [Psidium guajava]|nr:uncharacterized protein J3R85_005898 [Psidium guajava]